MKILVFSDIHGNLNCLKTLIDTDDWKNASLRIFLGDACVCFNRPNECIDLLQKLDCKKILGNNDQYACDHIPKINYDALPAGKLEQLDYMCKAITEENKQKARSWQKDISMELFGKKFYFTHYVWEKRNGDENVLTTPKEKSFCVRAKMFENIDADYYFFGHEHKENHFTDGKKHFYCLGSLGLVNPGYYLIINVDESGVKVTEKYLVHNIKEEIDLMKKAGYQYNKKRFPD